MCSLGTQLERLLSIVPRDRVLVIVLDDIASNPRNEYLRVLDFFWASPMTVARSSRFATLQEPLDGQNWHGALNLLLQAKRRLGMKGGLGAATWLMAATQFDQPRLPLPTDAAAILKEHFASDVELLGKLLGRNLRHWLT
jgi:hypothetical protein